MFRFDAEKSVHFCDGLRRRDFLHAGSLSLLGLGLADLGAEGAGRVDTDQRRQLHHADAGRRPVSQLDTWDMKPDAPAEIRGPFKPIKTNVPGIEISEIFPRMAKHADKFSLVRSVLSHAAAVHDTGHQMMQTGRLFQGGIEHPHVGCVLGKLKGPQGRRAAARDAAAADGQHRRQHAARAERRLSSARAYDPFVLNADPSDPNFKVPDLLPPDYLPAMRVDRRAATARARRQGASARSRQSQDARLLDSNFQSGVSLMSSQKAREAFDLHRRRPTRSARRYGMNRFGQCCLLARRLIEARRALRHRQHVRDGVQRDHLGHSRLEAVQPDQLLSRPRRPDVRPWRTARCSKTCSERGLLQNTLVVAIGEFGRTPKVNPAGGRDHWPQCWTILMGGGGVKGGQVVGASDEIGGYPRERPVAPPDVAATIYKALGIDLETPISAPRTGRSRSSTTACADQGAVLAGLRLKSLGVRLGVRWPSAVVPRFDDVLAALLAALRRRRIAASGAHARPANSPSCRTASSCAGRAAVSSCSSKCAPATPTSATAPPSSTPSPRRTRRSRRWTTSGARDGGARRPRVHHGPRRRHGARPRWSRSSARLRRSADVPQPCPAGPDEGRLQLGACHGALAGKNGFKLTLRGYDPEADYLTLTRQAPARRVNPVEPARSLMLLKPTLAVPHGGGKRFATDSPEYRVIAQWIAAGTPAPSDSDPAMTHLEVFPPAAR